MPYRQNLSLCRFILEATETAEFFGKLTLRFKNIDCKAAELLAYSITLSKK
jgi:hypothetical protein